MTNVGIELSNIACRAVGWGCTPPAATATQRAEAPPIRSRLQAARVHAGGAPHVR